MSDQGIASPDVHQDRNDKSMKFIILLFLVLSLPSIAFAASINLSNGNPTTINDPSQEFNVNVNLSINVDDGTKYYLRGVFYKPGSSNYCGLTWTGSAWFNGPYSTNDGWKNLPQIIIASNSGSFNIKAKIDKGDSGCTGNGNYNFKIQRYTLSGSSSFDDQNELSLNLNIPDPITTPTSVPTFHPTSIPTNSPSATPTTNPTVTPFIKKPAITSTPEPLPTSYHNKDSVLGMELTPSQEVTPDTEVKGMKKESISPGLVYLLLGGGFASIAVSVYLSIRNINRRRKDNPFL